MDVVFYLEIWFSYGEREHALSLARQIRRAGFRPRFVVEPRVVDHIADAGFEATAMKSPQEGFEIVRRIDPVAVIACELFNIREASVRALIATGKPIGTVDGTTLGIEINADPFKTPKLTRSLLLPERFFAFRPCPVNDPGADGELVCHYALFPDAARCAKDARIYASLGLDPARRTVLLPIALWAMNGARLAGLHAYYDRLVDRVVDGLAASGERVDLLVVGRFDPSRASVGAVDVHVVDLLGYEPYQHVLGSCDAVVSDNIIQTSVSRALMTGTPHLVIQNMPAAASQTPVGRGGLLSSDLPYRCNIFPVRQIFPPERAYAQGVEVAEFAAPHAVRDALVAILRDGYWDAARRARRDAYRARVASLADPGAALARLLGVAPQNA
jgi:hypothetical protein